jgi:hypothetical protein
MVPLVGPVFEEAAPHTAQAFRDLPQNTADAFEHVAHYVRPNL